MADDFLDYPNWFDRAFEYNLRRRYWTFRVALNLLYQLPSHSIVETGCTRLLNDWGAGYSSYIFANFVNEHGGHLTTIDISPENIEGCKRVTAEFAKDITYITENSLTALPRLERPIDLLYLDSLDIPEVGDATEGQEHNLKEFKVVEPLLHNGSIVLIDDNDMPNGGKSKLTNLYLAEKGWRLVLSHDQALWIR